MFFRHALGLGEDIYVHEWPGREIGEAMQEEGQ